MPVKIGYWNMRGFGEPIRLLLAYTGTQVEDKRYNWIKSKSDSGEWYGSQWDGSEWYGEKFTHGFDFPNIPYYIDDDVKLTQSMAILKYLGRKHQLIPRTETERIRIDLIESEALDMRDKLDVQCYGDFKNPYSMKDFERGKVGFLNYAKPKLKELSVFLGDRPYFAGNHITYVDFLIYELLDVEFLMEPTILDDVPNLKAYHDRIAGLSTIAAYLKSERFLRTPINGPMAPWGGAT